jgi:hypothetical protein
VLCFAAHAVTEERKVTAGLESNGGYRAA